ncbi:MAG TPA: response regulator [Chromatiales bacterium]|nr:response regulator [Chromatiales bacterium]
MTAPVATRPGSSDPSREAARVLVVDDDRLVLATVAGGLREAGYVVDTAESAREARERVEAARPDIALLDVRMPGETGIELARWLRARDIPFLFLTAYGDASIVREAVEEGALGYLIKPVDVPQLVAALEAALQRAEDIRRLRETEAQLQRALSGSRYTSMAVGLIMERHRLTEKEAFERLRRFARSQRRKIEDVAEELVRSEELVNLVK